MTVELEISRLVADARAHGLSSIDLRAVERILLRADAERRRLDRRRDDLMAVFPLD